MATRLKQDREALRQKGWEYLGSQASKLAQRERHGEVPPSEYNALHLLRVQLYVLQDGYLTDKKEEPILASIERLTNTFPGGVNINNPS